MSEKSDGAGISGKRRWRRRRRLAGETIDIVVRVGILHHVNKRTGLMGMMHR